MNLQFSEQQRLLQDSVQKFVRQAYPVQTRKAVAESNTRRHGPTWRSMAELGWLALPLPEAHGGLQGSSVDVGILMEGLGRGLLLEPFHSSLVLAGSLITALGSDSQQDRWLPQMADGSRRAVFAHQEPGLTPYDTKALRTTAVRTGDGWRLTGRKSMVVDGPGTDVYLVSAALEDGTPAVFLVAPDSQGLQAQPFETLDGRLACNLLLLDVVLPSAARLGHDRDAHAAIERALDHAVAAACAEAVGCMQVLLDATVEYTSTRMQFDKPLAANQVLRHRMVNMAVHCEEARAMALRAALYCDARQADAATRGRAVSGARIKVAESARFVAEGAVQLHGAMGVTEELDIGAYFKRLLAFDMYPGSRADHLARCISLRAAARKAEEA